MLSASQAAKAVGITKQGLMKAIREGRLSASKDANGAYQVDPSELFRVYEPVRPEKPGTEPTTNASGHNRTEMLEREIELLKERLRDKDDVISDIRRRLDNSEEAREKLNAVLVAQSERDRVPFWRRLLG